MRKSDAIKLVVSDLDGTMVGDGFPLEANIAELYRLKNLGIKTTIATGRPFPIAIKAFNTDCLTGPLILDNGALITELDGQPIYYKVVPQQTIDYVLSVANHPLVGIVAFVPLDGNHTIHQYVADRDEAKRMNELYHWAERVTTYDLNQLRVWLTTMRTSKVVVVLPKHFPELPTPPDSICHCNSLFGTTRCYDIMAGEVDKGQAVMRITSLLHLELSNVAVIGNDPNDRGMFKLPQVKKIFVRGSANVVDDLMKMADIVVNPMELPYLLRHLSH